MTPEILKEVEAVADDPVAAEKLCGKRNVEFHPLGCEAVLKATGDKDATCQHVPGQVRETRVAAFAALKKRKRKDTDES